MKFLLIAQPRTGTTLLRSLLNQHQDMYVYGEVLFPDVFFWGFFSYLSDNVAAGKHALLPTRWHRHFAPYLEDLSSLMYDAGKSWVGFDVKIPQLGFVPDIHRSIQDADLPVLHLRRRDSLAAIVSYELMLRRLSRGGTPHGRAPETGERIHLDLDWLKLRLAEFEAQDGWINLIYRQRKYQEIWYEDLISSAWPSVCDSLAGFFGAAFDVPFRTALEKQTNPDLSEVIENYLEVAALLGR